MDDLIVVFYLICAFLQWTYWIAKAYENHESEDYKFGVCVFGGFVSLLWPVFLTINAWRMTIRKFP